MAKKHFQCNISQEYSKSNVSENSPPISTKNISNESLSLRLLILRKNSRSFHKNNFFLLSSFLERSHTRTCSPQQKVNGTGAGSSAVVEAAPEGGEEGEGVAARLKQFVHAYEYLRILMYLKTLILSPNSTVVLLCTSPEVCAKNFMSISISLKFIFLCLKVIE